jgi:hypothetical protein
VNLDQFLKSLLRKLGLNPTKVFQTLSRLSLQSALREQRLLDLCEKLRQIVPDISDQYTQTIELEEYREFRELKTRGMHAFQVQRILQTIAAIKHDNITIADIGDSSGNHGAYIKALDTNNRIGRFLSVNLDPVAVKKVRSKGGEAIQCRAEELNVEGIKPDIVLLFEILEHLTDPIRFLHGLASDGNVDQIIATVPYRRKSRFGGAYLHMPKHKMPDTFNAENIHLFELNPEDWILLAKFAGYRTVSAPIYYQYPKRAFLRILSIMWRRYDFEGFLALHLVRDNELSERYVDW